MGRVWVVGSLNVDRPWRVARHPRVGETVTGAQLAPLPGGKGLNQAVAAVRMGADVAMVGAVGDDEDGRWLAAVAGEEGIDVSLVGRRPSAPTGSALIVIDDAGANTVTVAAGANAELALPDIPLEPGDVVVCQLEVPAEAVAAALGLAMDRGATSILNPSPVGAGGHLVALADVVVVNEHEAAALSGALAPATDHDEALRQARAIATGHLAVVVTLGPLGAVAETPLGPVVVPGEAVTPIDTTGAGDCFLGVLAAALATGSPVDAALARANRAAARSVTRLGTVPAMPRAADLDPT